MATGRRPLRRDAQRVLDAAPADVGGRARPPGAYALAGLSAPRRSAGFRFFGARDRADPRRRARGARLPPVPRFTIHESRRFAPSTSSAGTGCPACSRGRGRPSTPPRGSPTRVTRARCWRPSYSSGSARRGELADAAAVRRPGPAQADHATGDRRHRRRVPRHSARSTSPTCAAVSAWPPGRQAVRRDRPGRRRYLDCEWDLADGRVVVLEVDGSHHVEVEHWEADMKRERGDRGLSGARCSAAPPTRRGTSRPPLARRPPRHRRPPPLELSEPGSPEPPRTA